MDNRPFSAAKIEHNSAPPTPNFRHVFEARLDIFSIFFCKKEVIFHLADDDSTVGTHSNFFPPLDRGFAALPCRNGRKKERIFRKNTSFIPHFRSKNRHFRQKRAGKHMKFGRIGPFLRNLTLKMPLLGTPENLLKITKTGSSGADEAAIVLCKQAGIRATVC